MKLYIIISLAIASMSGCAEEKRTDTISYIKVIKENTADSATDYNQGLGLDQYLYYSFVNDSVVYRTHTYTSPKHSITFVGKFENESYRDTVEMFVKVLMNNASGIINVDSSVFIDPEPAKFYIEYKDENGIHNRTFLAIKNDTLSRFAWFLDRLVNTGWSKNLASEGLFDSEKEIVEAAKKTGQYK